MDKYEKLYNEALERFKSFKEKYYTKDTNLGDVIFDKNGEMQKDFNGIFPELAESEDERIRKEIVSIVKQYGRICEKEGDPCCTINDCLAYLEKQKENPKSADSIPSDCVSDAKCEDKSPKHSDSDGTDIRDTPAYWKGWDDAMKQKEQEHPNGCFTCDEYKKGYEAGRLNGFTAGYNKAMKEVDQKEQKPAEWSQEDEKIVNNIVSILSQYIDYKAVSGTGSGYATPKYTKEIDWLKSLRPHWKPSEEQMEALAYAIQVLAPRAAKASEELENLREQLEKLKGGVAPMREIDE